MSSKAEQVIDAMADNSLVLKPKWWMAKTAPLKGQEHQKIRDHLAADAHIYETEAIEFVRKKCCQLRMIRYKGKTKPYYVQFEGSRYNKILVCRFCGDYFYD